MSRGSHAEPTRSRAPAAIVLACALVFALVSPLRGMWTARGDVNELRTEEISLDKRIAALQWERDQLGTDPEIERRARADLGMVRPGETSVIIPGKEAPPLRLPFVEAADEGLLDPGVPLLTRWWQAVRRIARVGV